MLWLCNLANAFFRVCVTVPHICPDCTRNYKPRLTIKCTIVHVLQLRLPHVLQIVKKTSYFKLAKHLKSTYWLAGIHTLYTIVKSLQSTRWIWLSLFIECTQMGSIRVGGHKVSKTSDQMKWSRSTNLHFKCVVCFCNHESSFDVFVILIVE